MFRRVSQWVTTTVKCPRHSSNPSDKSDGDSLEAEIIIQKVLNIHHLLVVQENLEPSLEINELFGELVEICTKNINEGVTRKVLESPLITAIIQSLRTICSRAECALEFHWASLVINTRSRSNTVDDPFFAYVRLTSFPYIDNYTDLTRMELSAITSITDDPIEKIAFIGSGPLPLTSLCLSGVVALPGQTALPRAKVLNIDCDETAISKSTHLYSKFTWTSGKMEFMHSEAKDLQDLRDFDVVYLAALVGNTQTEKEELLKIVTGKMTPGKLLVIRSAERLRKLMYADLDPSTNGVTECLDICLVMHPFNHMINSVIIGKVKGGDDKQTDEDISLSPVFPIRYEL